MRRMTKSHSMPHVSPPCESLLPPGLQLFRSLSLSFSPSPLHLHYHLSGNKRYLLGGPLWFTGQDFLVVSHPCLLFLKKSFSSIPPPNTTALSLEVAGMLLCLPKTSRLCGCWSCVCGSFFFWVGFLNSLSALSLSRWSCRRQSYFFPTSVIALNLRKYHCRHTGLFMHLTFTSFAHLDFLQAAKNPF